MRKIVVILLLLICLVTVGFIEPTNVLTVDDLAMEGTDEKLPKVYLDGELDKLVTKENEIKIEVKYESKTNSFKSYAEIKLQGSSSLAYEKKNYTIKLYEDEMLTKKYKIDLGWGAQYKYCLKANWVDKTQARNVVTARIAAKVQEKYNLLNDTPNHGLIDGYPVEVYTNGEFLGLYTMNIPKGAWQFNMDEGNKNHLVFVGDSWSETTMFREEANFHDWELEVGEETDYSLDKLNRLISFINNSSDKEFKRELNKYINFDSLLNYYVISEVAQLKDNVGKNMILLTYDGDMWYISLYDLDTSWGVQWQGLELFNYDMIISPGIEPYNSKLFERFEKAFPNEIADRYFELREDIITKDYILGEFAKFINSIPDDVYEKEAERWENIPGFDIKQIEDYLNNRLPILDRHFFEMYNRSPSSIKSDKKKINSLWWWLAMVLAVDCDGEKLDEFDVVWAVWHKEIDFDKETNVGPRAYCVVCSNDGAPYLVSIYDHWNKKAINRFENRNDDDEVPIKVLPISESINYELAYTADGEIFNCRDSKEY